LAQAFAHALMHRSATPPSRGGTYRREPRFGNSPYFWAAITNNQGPSHWPGTSQDRAGPSPALLFPPKSLATVGRKTQGRGNSSTCPLSGNPMAPECHGGLTGVLKSDLSRRPMPGAKSLCHHRAGQHLKRVTGTWLMVASRFRNGVSFARCHLAENRPTVVQAGQSRHFQSQVGDRDRVSRRFRISSRDAGGRSKLSLPGLVA